MGPALAGRRGRAEDWALRRIRRAQGIDIFDDALRDPLDARRGIICHVPFQPVAEGRVIRSVLKTGLKPLDQRRLL